MKEERKELTDHPIEIFEGRGGLKTIMKNFGLTSFPLKMKQDEV